jgi:DNA-binding MurR/RpiR family transcriptional regulator
VLSIGAFRVIHEKIGVNSVAGSISENIAERLEAMPSSERRAAQALFADYPLIGLKTVAEFAQRAGISSPTVLRFVNRLGFQNYADFQSALQRELVQQVQSPLLRSRAQNKMVSKNGMSPFVQAIVDNIEETFSHLSAPDMDRLAKLLSDPKRRLHLLGGRFTDAIARYMTAHLRIIRADVFHIVGQEGTWWDQLVDMGKRDVLIVFDIRRYQESLLNFSQRATARGVSVVLITDQWLSPIARVAKQVITCRTAVPSAWDSSAALMVLVEVLAARLTAESGAQASKRIADLEALRNIP